MYFNMKQCFMIKALFGCKEQKLTQADLKRNNYCKDAIGNSVNINRQVLKCSWASEELEWQSRPKSYLRPEMSIITDDCSINFAYGF